MRNERGEFARGVYRYHDHIGIVAKRGRVFGKRKKPMHESKVENLSPERPQMQWADSRILCWTGWGAILVLAIWFRIWPIGSGLPYSDYIDEGPCFIKQSTRLTTAVSTFPGTGCPIGARFAGNRPGLVAMLLMAVCPALVTRGSIIIADTFATFCACSSLLLRAHPNGNEQDDLARRGARRSSNGACLCLKVPRRDRRHSCYYN